MSDLVPPGIPSGTILAFAGVNTPPGYIWCDGRSLARDEYPSLFAAIGTRWGTASASTFNIPNTMGLFLRGVDTGAGYDPDYATRTAIKPGGTTVGVGSYQADEFRSHNHGLPIVNNQAASAGSGVPSFSGMGPNTSSTGGNETRPKNIYVQYIIKI